MRYKEIETKKKALQEQVTERTTREIERANGSGSPTPAEASSHSKLGIFMMRRENLMEKNMEAVARLAERVSKLQRELTEVDTARRPVLRKMQVANVRLEEAKEVLQVLQDSLVDILRMSEGKTELYLLDSSPEAKDMHIKIRASPASELKLEHTSSTESLTTC